MTPKEIFERDGVWCGHLELPEIMHTWVREENYKAIDEWAHKSLETGGEFREFLSQFGEFKETEHILALRAGPDDEDGIWHDDSSRLFAFSWALTQNANEVVGGELLFRAYGTPIEKATQIKALPAGGLIIFKTGQFGYEHKVNQVTYGKRFVFTGWLS